MISLLLENKQNARHRVDGLVKVESFDRRYVRLHEYRDNMIGFILFILISLGVINSLFMSIYERIYEFGVLSAIGTSRWEVISLVLLEALFLGIISSLIGLVIGAVANYYFSMNGLPLGEMEFSGIMFGNGNLYTELAIDQFIFLPLYVILLTLITAIYPAFFASRIIPTEALQRAL